MRCLSLVNCIEVKFTGKVLKEAICLGDCNNDGLHELVVGNTDGDLFVYRGNRCIAKSSELGTISAVAVGDLLNISKNVTVALTVEGWCHIFDVEYELSLEDLKDGVSSIDASASIAEYKIVQPFHSQRVVANVKEAKVDDVDNDGRMELIVGLTDRVLRTYRWCSELDMIDRDRLPIFEAGEDRKGVMVVGEQRSEVNELVFNGKLSARNKWEFPNQIGSIALHKQGKSTCILVGQPGGTVSKISNAHAIVQHQQQQQGSNLVDKQQVTHRSRNTSANSNAHSQFEVEHFPLNSGKVQNPATSTEVVPNVFGREGKADHYAVATLDGTIMLCHDNTFEIITHLDSPLLTLESCNGSFIAICWDGETYLVKRTVDQEVENCIIHFSFEESVAGFKVGSYAFPLDDDDTQFLNQNCLVYVTFHGNIYIYPSQHL